MDKAKIFWTGKSQAVRLPKKYRFEAKEVRIIKKGHCLILEPIGTDWSWLDSLTGSVDEDFVKAVEEPITYGKKPERDDFFR